MNRFQPGVALLLSLLWEADAAQAVSKQAADTYALQIRFKPDLGRIPLRVDTQPKHPTSSVPCPSAEAVSKVDNEL